jgi:hypothetical protein
MNEGQVGILNVGAGDTKLSFDPNNYAERIRAARIVKDMLRRGYALLIAIPQKEGDTGPQRYARAIEFDENTCEYIIADFDPIVAKEADALEEENDSPEDSRATPGESSASKKSDKVLKKDETPDASSHGPRGRGKRRIDANKTTAVGVARTAGG